MSPQVASLVERHSGAVAPRVAELMRAIRAGSVSLCSLSEASSRELAQTYAVRSDIARSQGRLAVATEMQQLSEMCRANQGDPCSVWAFEGAEFSFALFELLPTHVVAGCFRFDGPFRLEDNGT